MAARPTWKGYLKVSLVTIPVKVFPATESAASIAFNQLHRECNTRIQMKKWCPSCDREVPNNEIVKGYEHAKGNYVVMEEEDIAKVRVESTKVIDLAQFADESEIDPIYVDRAYYLAPDGPMAAQLLVWEAAKPRYYGLNLGLGAMFGVLLAMDVFVLDRPLAQLFGEVMMCAYYGYAFPMSVRIARGFYDDGVWADTGFMPWTQISAMSWKEEPSLKLILVSRVRSIARHLTVPGPLYGQVRRLLRDRIAAHDIQIGGAGLDLGVRDERDAV